MSYTPRTDAAIEKFRGLTGCNESVWAILDVVRQLERENAELRRRLEKYEPKPMEDPL